MKIIHDNIHGEMEFTDLAISIIDTLPFQRLHELKQTSTSFKVWPSSVHTRFEHSCGVYHLTGQLLTSLLNNQPELCEDVDERRKELIKIAGLCHDLGHSIYSHTFDRYFLPKLKEKYKDDDLGEWEEHENRSIALFRYLVRTDNIDLNDDEVNEICEYIHPNNNKNWYANIVCNTINGIDYDKLDYLVRDAKSYGLHMDIDVNRIITNSRVIDNEICFCANIKDDIFNIFYVRYRLFKEIFTHHKIIACELMIRDILMEIDDRYDIYNIIKNQNCEEFIKLTDEWMVGVANTTLLSLFRLREGYDYISEINSKYETTECDIIECETAEYESFDVKIGFISESSNPFDSIQYYSRKNPNKKYNILPHKINMLLRDDYTDYTEIHKFSYKKTY